MQSPGSTPLFDAHHSTNGSSATQGGVRCLAWTLDGYALSAGYAGQGGLVVWSVYGAMLCSTNEVENPVDSKESLAGIHDAYIHQVNDMVTLLNDPSLKKRFCLIYFF